MKLEDKIRALPTNSGVYVMRGETGEVIYVGKAKNLKNRVTQYFRKNSSHTLKVKAMVEKIYDFDYFITLSEMDALALESNLIKKYQPFFNILLKDGKAFPYIKINFKEKYPRLEIVRKIKRDGSKYFGPYFAGISAGEILKTISSAFKIRTCKQSLEKPQKRECLNYFLGLCSAPCTRRISEEDYRKILDDVVDFLNGNDNKIEKILKEKMKAEAEKENFEVALELRERLKMIDKLKERVVANLPKDLSLDVFAYESDGLSGAITNMVVRGGKILGVLNVSVIDASLDEGEALSSYIMQYYKNVLVPKEVLVSAEISGASALEEYLKTNIICPKKGVKHSLVEMARKNAREHLSKSLSKDKQKFNQTFGALEKLKEALSLTRLPKRIECYDISNTSGLNSVASMTVMINGELKHSHYRKFKIKTVEGPNDFESLKEVITRRLTELSLSKDESFKMTPDLIVIDGGKGQLSSCYEVLKNSEYSEIIDMVSLAKKFEEVYLPGKSVPVMLKRGSAELRLLTSIRDEAHRFGITFHRSLRDKRTLLSSLDDIRGIGEVKKRALQKQFGTLTAIKEANADELALVKGIDPALAERIYKHFHTD